MSCGPMIAGGSCGASHSRHAGAPARGQGRSGRAGPGCSRGGGGPSGAAAGGWGGRGLAGRSLGRCRAGPARLPGLRAVRGRAREPPGARRGSGHGSGGSAGRRVPGAWCRHGWSGRDRAGPARVGSDSCRAGCGASGDRRRTAGRSAVRRRAVRGHWPHRRERSAPGARPARRRRGARGGASRPLMPLDFLIARFDELPATRALATGLPGPGARVPVSGLPGSSPALLIAALARRFPQRVFVVITSTPTDAERWLADARALAGDAAAALYPQREALGAEEPHVEIAGERIETLEALLSGKVNILVTTARATAERTAVPAALAAMRLVLATGLGARGPGSGGLTDVVNRLSAMGYTRVPTVTEVAQFSVRGGILDVYGFGMAAPTRVEWSGDEIVSLRPFDLDSQRSGGDRVERVTILPARSEELSGTGEAQGAAPLWRQALLDLSPTDGRLVVAGPPTVILCDNEGQLERLEELLGADAATLAIGALDGGFVLPSLRVLTDHEIFRRARRLRRPRRYREASPTAAARALQQGDYVVHLEHGIGLYRGIQTIAVGAEGGTLEVAVGGYERGDPLNTPRYPPAPN